MSYPLSFRSHKVNKAKKKGIPTNGNVRVKMRLNKGHGNSSPDVELWWKTRILSPLQRWRRGENHEHHHRHRKTSFYGERWPNHCLRAARPLFLIEVVGIKQCRECSLERSVHLRGSDASFLAYLDCVSKLSPAA